MYIEKLFEEFKRVYGINNTKLRINNFKDEFEKWLNKKQLAAIDYVKLLEEMDFYSASVAEIGKGLYDTISFELKNDYFASPIIISPYADSFLGFEDEFDIYKGSLKVNKDDVIIQYYNDSLVNPCFYDIDILMTQLPLSIEEMVPFLKLLNSNKTLYLGTYGSVDDKNNRENIEELTYLFQKFLDNSKREIVYSSETNNNNYMAVIRVDDKPRLRTKI